MKIASLNLTTGYSFSKSIIQIDNYCKLAKSYGYDVVGINDDDIFSYPEFEKYCLLNSLKPIFLKPILIEFPKLYKKLNASFYIKTEEGYLNILKLYRNKIDSISISELEEYKNGLGLIIYFDEDFSFKDFQNMISPFLLKIKNIFNNSMYFGAYYRNQKEEKSVNESYSFFDENEYKIIPFPPIKYLKKNDCGLYEIFSNINDKKEINIDINKSGPEFLYKPEIFQKLYRNQDYLNLKELVENIDFTFFKQRGSIIKFDNDSEILKEKCYSSLKKKNLYNDRYLKRLEFELKTINLKGFASYFLLVEDFVLYSKENNIRVGYGRGSAVGCLISFLLDITKLDPIRFNLSFERFLNPERKTMPDIDIDVEDDKREELILHLKRKYGEDKVANISTYNKIKPKSSINLLGKALKIPEVKLKAITSLIPKDSSSFKDAMKKDYYGKLKKLLEDPLYQELVSNCNKLLNLPVSKSIHASGIIISKNSLSLSLPMSNMSTGEIMFEASYLEEMGFLKFDILSLSNLSFLNNIIRNIEDFNVDDLINNLEDKDTYKTLNNLFLSDIFQLDEGSSYGMKNTIKKIHPDNFDELALILALYRPGSLKFVDDLARRKKGIEKITYLHPLLEPILKNTYGIIIYQEQVMEVVKTIANFSLAEADIFRRAISKKKIDEMEKYKIKFYKQAKENNIDENTSKLIFDNILSFASYGFNKSHAYAYSFLTYIFLYLKTHYPINFYQAAINKDPLSSLKGRQLFVEIKKIYQNIKVDINYSLYDKFNISNNTLYLPLNIVSNINKEFIDKLLSLKEDKFQSYQDFFYKVSSLFDDLDDNNIRLYSSQISNLIKAGYFDCFNLNRSTMLNNLDNFINACSFKDLILKQEIKLYSENIGLKFYEENKILGVLLSSTLRKNNNSSYLYVTDIIQAFDKLIINLSDGIKEYNLKVDKNLNVERYSFYFIEADFNKTYLNPTKIKYIGTEIKHENNIHS